MPSIWICCPRTVNSYNTLYCRVLNLPDFLQVSHAYKKIFDELGVPWIRVAGDTGVIGGSESHEFHYPAGIGETETWGRIQRKTWCMGPYAGVDYNRPFCLLQSRLQCIYHGQPYARVDLNPLPESTLSRSQGFRIWPQREWKRRAEMGAWLCTLF